MNKLDAVLAEVEDTQSGAVALGLFIGIAVARQGADLDEAMAWLKGVAGWGMQLHAEGRIEEARIN